MWKQVEVPEGTKEVIDVAREEVAAINAELAAVALSAAQKPKRKKMIVAPGGDMVNSPAHYIVGGVETIDFIEAKGLGYHLGNCIKYISRADYKGDRLEDLKKARWYLQREIDRLEKVNE